MELHQNPTRFSNQFSNQSSNQSFNDFDNNLTKKLTMISHVRIPSEAIKLFSVLEKKYSLTIPYKIVTRGENEGLLKVLPVRVSEREDAARIEKLIRINQIDWIMDHQCTFRTLDDETVLMFSPYGAIMRNCGEIKKLKRTKRMNRRDNSSNSPDNNPVDNSPYAGQDSKYADYDDGEFFGGLQIAVSDYSIYGNGTKTFIAWEN